MTSLSIAEWRDLNNNKIKSSAQVVTATKTNTWSSNSTAWVDIPDLQPTITPYYATSKILVIIKLSITPSTPMHGMVRLTRNGTVIAAGDASASRISCLFGMYGTTTYNTCGYEPRFKGAFWLDSPATTSAVTYKLQYANPHSSSYGAGVNYNAYTDSDSAWNYNTSSSVTLMEIMQ
jgi:hypothetical protein